MSVSLFIEQHKVYHNNHRIILNVLISNLMALTLKKKHNAD